MSLSWLSSGHLDLLQCNVSAPESTLGCPLNNETGILVCRRLSFHNAASNLTPHLEKENQVFSAIFGGLVYLATGYFGLAMMAFCSCRASDFASTCGTARSAIKTLPRLLFDLVVCRSSSFLLLKNLLQQCFREAGLRPPTTGEKSDKGHSLTKTKKMYRTAGDGKRVSHH